MCRLFARPSFVPVLLNLRQSTSGVADRSTPAITFSTLLSTSTKLSAKVKTTPPYSVYAVRPTTPMGDVVTSTIKVSSKTRIFDE